ncbi:MAG: DUF503 domain-containing protein [Phycisphaerales bacterium]
MKIAVLQFDLLLHDAASLKDKRRVVKSLKDRLHREHQASVAEVGSQDDCRRARIGVAIVGNDVPRLQASMDRILDKARAQGEASLGPVFREILHGDNTGGIGLGGEESGDLLDDLGGPLWQAEERR